MVETYGTGKVSNETLTALVRKHFDLRPKGIVNMLDLLRPIYQKTAAYGHFGRDEPEFSWEAPIAHLLRRRWSVSNIFRKKGALAPFLLNCQICLKKSRRALTLGMHLGLSAAPGWIIHSGAQVRSDRPQRLALILGSPIKDGST
jgi:hypothetical protein